MTFLVSWKQAFFHMEEFNATMSRRQLLKDWRPERPLDQRMMMKKAGETGLSSQCHHQILHWCFSRIYLLICVFLMGALLSLQKLWRLWFPRSQEVKPLKADVAREAELVWVVVKWEKNIYNKCETTRNDIVGFKVQPLQQSPRKPWEPEH